MAGTASDQWWWNDWQGEPTLKTCSFAAQGVWMRMLCVMAEADKKGYFRDTSGRRMSMERFAKIAGGPIAEVTALVEELGREGVYSKDRHGDLYCRKMVKLELKRKASAKGGKTGGPASHSRGVGIHASEPVDKSLFDPVTGELTEPYDVSSREISAVSPFTTSDISITRGATRHPKETPSHSHKKEEDNICSTSPRGTGRSNRSSNGTTNGRNPNHVTLQSQDERINRFAQWLSTLLAWTTIAAAMDKTHQDHAYALAKCQKAARDNGKGWPHAWPIDAKALP